MQKAHSSLFNSHSNFCITFTVLFVICHNYFSLSCFKTQLLHLLYTAFFALVCFQSPLLTYYFISFTSCYYDVSLRNFSLVPLSHSSYHYTNLYSFHSLVTVYYFLPKPYHTFMTSLIMHFTFIWCYLLYTYHIKRYL